MRNRVFARFSSWVPLALIVCVIVSARSDAGEKERRGYLLSPKAFRAAAARVDSSIVSIETYGGVNPKASGRGRNQGIRKPGEGPTTGLVISADGYIITSTFNFVRKPPIITVTLGNGTRKVAKLLGRDETRRLCVLKVDGVSDLAVPEFVSRKSLRVGQWAITVGVGYGDVDPAISAGIISALSRISGRAVQTDANISPANYGGPLLDIEGRVIGICVPLAPGGRGGATSGVQWYDSGIGFAVPLAGAEKLIVRMKAGEVIRPGKMGVQVAAGKDKQGVVVKKVLNGSAAAKAGIKDGDRIVKINGADVFDVQQLMILLGRYVESDEISVTIARGEAGKEEEKTLQVTLQAGLDQPSAPTGKGGKRPRPPEPKDDPTEKDSAKGK